MLHRILVRYWTFDTVGEFKRQEFAADSSEEVPSSPLEKGDLDGGSPTGGIREKPTPHSFF